MRRAIQQLHGQPHQHPLQPWGQAVQSPRQRRPRQLHGRRRLLQACGRRSWPTMCLPRKPLQRNSCHPPQTNPCRFHVGRAVTRGLPVSLRAATNQYPCHYPSGRRLTSMHRLPTPALKRLPSQTAVPQPQLRRRRRRRAQSPRPARAASCPCHCQLGMASTPSHARPLLLSCSCRQPQLSRRRRRWLTCSPTHRVFLRRRPQPPQPQALLLLPPAPFPPLQ